MPQTGQIYKVIAVNYMSIFILPNPLASAIFIQPCFLLLLEKQFLLLIKQSTLIPILAIHKAKAKYLSHFTVIV